MRKHHVLMPLSIAFVLAGLVVAGHAQGPVTDPNGRLIDTGQMLPEDQAGDTLQSNTAALASFRSEITYLGSLTDGSGSANGDYDLEFQLYDSATLGAQIGDTIDKTFTITNGLFTASMDFGADAFPGDPRYLEIHVRRSSGGSFTTLSPRQELTAVPYAMLAYRANGLAASDGDPVSAVYIDDTGRVGIGTASPLVELHIAGDNSPAIRLNQDGSGAWPIQVWDVVGNESNFYIRDATDGSKLPFRIQPGAPTSSLTIKADGDVGIGTWYPESRLQVTDGYLQLDTSAGMPPAIDCDTAAEIGRMKVDESNANLYVCTDSGWVTK